MNILQKKTPIWLWLLISLVVVACGATGETTDSGSSTTAAADTTLPTVGLAISFSSVTAGGLTVNWGAGADDQTTEEKLQYKLVKDDAAAANIDTVAEANSKTGADLLQDWAVNTLSSVVSGLATSTTYHFSVLVRDEAGNMEIYSPASQATTADTTAPTPGAAISFSAVTSASLVVNWGAASDDITTQANLEYKVVTDNTSITNIDTIAEVEAKTGADIKLDYTSNAGLLAIGPLSASTTYHYAVIVRDAAGNKALYSPASQTTLEGVAPTLVSSTPADAATGIAVCSGSPCRAKITLVFSESMNTNFPASTALQTEMGGAFITVDNFGTSFSWSTTTNTNDTLTIEPSWYWFPENTLIRYRIFKSQLKDLAGNELNDNLQQTFTTGYARQGFAVSDSGQGNCYDNTTGPNSCPQSGGLHPGQDGDFSGVPNARSFSGPTQHGTYSSDYTTLDNVTGLTWKSCTDSLSGPACSSGSAFAVSWYSAVNRCRNFNTMNAGNGYAGRTNWRLPTIRELLTLPNLSGVSPAIDSAAFPATPTSNSHWSATSDSTSNAWNVSTAFGHSGSPTSKSNNGYVRCVSSPAISTSIFTDNGDGTVTDSITNLRWQKCSRGQNNDATCTGTANKPNWATALQYCDSLSLGSFGNSSNWRVPSIRELKSLVDISQTGAHINTTGFPSTLPAAYWTSTTDASSANRSWVISFSAGSDHVSAKTSNEYLRCVATGP